ncbi:MAG: hypothetical protein OES24_22070 [Acidimicrobiia bacterium]|nr:hypothetical protein [Acidimicrobiia bacterium]
MTQVVTLGELSSRIGVDVDHLQRMIRVGSLPEASRQQDADGSDEAVWVIPVEALPDLADRHGWSIDTVDLTSAHQPVVWMAPTHENALTAPADFTRTEEEVTVAEIIDGALLSRLLGAHEERAEAEARARESQRAMTAMAEGQQRMVRELAEERYERQRVNDRFRDERNARLIADAKLAELRARVEHEAAVVERERQARLEANRRIAEAERQAAAAVASMSWLARRRLQRRLDMLDGGSRPGTDVDSNR